MNACLMFSSPGQLQWPTTAGLILVYRLDQSGKRLAGPDWFRELFLHNNSVLNRLSLLQIIGMVDRKLTKDDRFFPSARFFSFHPPLFISLACPLHLSCVCVCVGVCVYCTVKMIEAWGFQGSASSKSFHAPLCPCLWHPDKVCVWLSGVLCVWGS